MKENYNTPEMEIMFLAIHDVVCTSGDGYSVTIPENGGWTDED